jgi:predicted RecB family nuclease
MKIDSSIKGEALRRTLHNIVEERLRELKVIAMTGVKGIGVRYATQLVEAGIESVEELAHYETHELAHRTNVSNRVAARWIQRAQQTIT